MVVLIRPTRQGAQVPATAHGLLAAAVSLLLGVAAHSLGSGTVPSAIQIVVLGGLAACVGLVRAAQLRAVERDRSRGYVKISGTAVLAALVVGQVGAHVALALMDAHGAHGASLVPGPVMLMWHVLAIPAAAAMLFAAERLNRTCGDGVARVWRIITAPVLGNVFVMVAAGDHSLLTLRPSPMVAAAGVRGPPVQV